MTSLLLLIGGWSACDGGKHPDSTPREATPPVLSREPSETEKIVFEALDLRRPDMQGVATAVAAGDYDAATRAWAEHVRTRQGFTWGDPGKPGKYNRKVAEDALTGKVTGGYVPLPYPFPGGNIDWHFNATDHIPGQSHNNEWQWQLNRMMFWPDMAGAYAETGNDAFASVFGKQLQSWVQQCPMPTTLQNGSGSSWRTIEVGIRLGQTWFPAFLGLVKSPGLSDQDILTFTRSVIEQGRYLRKYQTDVNWLLMEMNGLATAGFYFPELTEATEWRAFALDTLAREMKHQFLPDGGHYELSTGYHPDVVIPNFLAPVKVATWTGRRDEAPAAYTEGLEKAYDWVEWLTTPNRNRPKVNDSWPGRAQLSMAEAARLFPERQDFLWLATDGAQGQPPRQTSIFLDWSGLAVMRSGWERDANYLLFDVGPLGLGGHMGFGHAHQDKLNVVIWAYGREILFDNGGSSYSWDKWRIWSRSSLSHNCVIVDGLGQDLGADSARESTSSQEKDPERVSQQPIDASWVSNAAFDFASATYTGPHGTSEYTPHVPGVYDMAAGRQHRMIAAQRRTVLFLKPDVFLVADTMTPYDDQTHTYQARWQILSTATTVDEASGVVLTTDAGQPNLAVVPLRRDGLAIRAVSGQEQPEILGWNCRKDETPGRLPATTVLHTLTGAGRQSLLTLFLPLRKGEGNPVKTVTRQGDDIEISLTDGRRLRVSDLDGRGISATEILPDGATGRSASKTF